MSGVDIMFTVGSPGCRLSTTFIVMVGSVRNSMTKAETP